MRRQRPENGILQRLISLSYHLDATADALRDAPEFTAEQLVLARQMVDLTLNEARRRPPRRPLAPARSATIEARIPVTPPR